MQPAADKLPFSPLAIRANDILRQSLGRATCSIDAYSFWFAQSLRPRWWSPPSSPGFSTFRSATLSPRKRSQWRATFSRQSLFPIAESLEPSVWPRWIASYQECERTPPRFLVNLPMPFCRKRSYWGNLIVTPPPGPRSRKFLVLSPILSLGSTETQEFCRPRS